MSQKEKQPEKVTIWQMIRDVLIEAMKRGQLLPAGVMLLVLIVAAKYPSNGLPSLLSAIYKVLLDTYLIGYIGFVVLAFLWYTLARKSREAHKREYERLGNEKSRLQELITGQNLPSSDDNH